MNRTTEFRQIFHTFTKDIGCCCCCEKDTERWKKASFVTDANLNLFILCRTWINWNECEICTQNMKKTHWMTQEINGWHLSISFHWKCSDHIRAKTTHRNGDGDRGSMQTENYLWCACPLSLNSHFILAAQTTSPRIICNELWTAYIQLRMTTLLCTLCARTWFLFFFTFIYNIEKVFMLILYLFCFVFLLACCCGGCCFYGWNALEESLSSDFYSNLTFIAHHFRSIFGKKELQRDFLVQQLVFLSENTFCYSFQLKFMRFLFFFTFSNEKEMIIFILYLIGIKLVNGHWNGNKNQILTNWKMNYFSFGI